MFEQQAHKAKGHREGDRRPGKGGGVIKEIKTRGEGGRYLP
jgi:hypothetical protein